MDGASDQHPLVERSKEEWEDILRKALPGFTCRACNGKEWLAVDQPPGSVGALQYADRETGRPVGYLRSVPFYCSDCGLMEIFSQIELLRRVGLIDGD